MDKCVKRSTATDYLQGCRFAGSRFSMDSREKSLSWVVPSRRIARGAGRGWLVALLLTVITFGPVAFSAKAWAQDGLPAPDDLSADAEPESENQNPSPAAQPTDEFYQPEPIVAPTAEAGSQATPEPLSQSEVNNGRDERWVDTTLTLEGATGFQHIASAKPGLPQTYRIAFFGEIFSGNDVVRLTDENTRVVGRLLIQASFLEYFSAFFGVSSRSNVNSLGQPETMITQGDLNLGVRGHYELAPGMTLAGDLTTYVPAGFGSAGLDFSGTSLRPRLLATADLLALTDNLVPLSIHFNAGYRFDNTENTLPDNIGGPSRIERFAYQISAYDFVELGLGAEYALPYVSPFLSFNMNTPLNGPDEICDRFRALECLDDAGIGAIPKWLSLGARAEPVEHLQLHAGVDFSLTTEDAEGIPVTPAYNIVLGAAWTIDPRPKVEYIVEEVEVPKAPEAPPEGFLVGLVSDAETDKPVENAIVAYLDSADTPQATAKDTGVFRTYDFAVGTSLKLRVSHPDYEPKEVSETIDAPGEKELRVQLTPIVKFATIEGAVTNADDEVVPNAVVKLTGPQVYQTKVGSDGEFSQEVKPGAYTVAVSAEGYQTRGRDVQVKPEERLRMDVVLVPKAEKQLVELQEEKIAIKDRIYFDTGKASIQPRSFPLLDQIVSVLLENPGVEKVRIEGHTDDVGEYQMNMDLSRDRAQAVREYLIENGISASRLESEGFGPTQPILPNISERNRALNRRVEFKVIRQSNAE